MGATIKDIQAMTHLSLSTISKYINGGKVRKENKAKLDEAIRALDFKANYFARNLKANRSNTIGVLIPRLNSTFYATIIAYIEDDLREFGYDVIVCDNRSDMEREKKALDFLISKRIDGLVLAPVDESGRLLQLCAREKLPVVLIDCITENLQADGVVINNRQASRDVLEECLKRGHRRIGIITGASHSFTSRGRLSGYEDALRDYGIPMNPGLVAEAELSIVGGYEACKKILGASEPCTALYCVNYEVTLGAIMAINELGYTIGEDISLCGFDSMELTGVVTPQLTMAAQPLREMASKAAGLLLKRLRGEADEDAYSIVTLRADVCQGGSIRDLRQDG